MLTVKNFFIFASEFKCFINEFVDSDDSPSQRFNPFDRSDGSRTSSSSSEDNRSSSANGLAELGLTEDHFSVKILCIYHFIAYYLMLINYIYSFYDFDKKQIII